MRREESCATCRCSLDIELCDYSQGGCIHSDVEGYICTAFEREGYAMWMKGNNRNTGMCECYTPLTKVEAYKRQKCKEEHEAYIKARERAAHGY